MVSSFEKMVGGAFFPQAGQNTMTRRTKTENVKQANYIKIEQSLCLPPSHQCQLAPIFAVSTCVYTVKFLYLYGQN
jgi:hypothetical protein